MRWPWCMLIPVSLASAGCVHHVAPQPPPPVPTMVSINPTPTPYQGVPPELLGDAFEPNRR